MRMRSRHIYVLLSLEGAHIRQDLTIDIHTDPCSFATATLDHLWNSSNPPVPVATLVPMPTQAGTWSPKPASQRARCQSTIFRVRSRRLRSRTDGCRFPCPKIMPVTTRNPKRPRRTVAVAVAVLTKAHLHQHDRLREPSLSYY